MGMAEVLSPKPAPTRQWWMELAPCHTEESQSPGLRLVTETTELHTTFTLSRDLKLSLTLLQTQDTVQLFSNEADRI